MEARGNAELGLEDLGEQIILAVLVERLLDYDLHAAINLSMTCSAINVLFERGLAARKLLRLVVDVNHVCKDQNIKLEQVRQLIAAYPSLMFASSKVKDSHGREIVTSPVKYIFSSPDLYLQQEFLGAAENNGLLERFVEQASQQPCEADISLLDDLFDKQLENIDLAANFADNFVGDDDDIDVFEQITEEIHILAQTKIGPAEFDLPRSIIDEAVKPRLISGLEHAFEDPTPPDEYILFDYTAREGTGGVIDALEFAEDAIPGKDFILTSARDEIGDLILSRSSSLDYEKVRRDKVYFHSLFNKCIEKQNELLEVARGKLIHQRAAK